MATSHDNFVVPSLSRCCEYNNVVYEIRRTPLSYTIGVTSTSTSAQTELHISISPSSQTELHKSTHTSVFWS